MSVVSGDCRLEGCPPAEVIVRLAGDDLGRGRSPDAVEVEKHVAQCRSCLERLLAAGQKPSFPNIKQCHIVREIGRGRFGVVYKAWWLAGPPRVVALKVLTYTGALERRRFEREAAVLEQLDVPGIVKCLHHGTVDDTPYYIMEYVEGAHLDEFLAYKARGLAEKLTVLARVCRAVGEAHERGVVHRDLKPRNILIDGAGNPHILDFGICSVTAAEWGSSVRDTITSMGDLVGTLKYMSPEQAWGGASGPIDSRSDVWALGILLYEIVTDGQYPYRIGATKDKTSQEALLERIRKEMPRMPRVEELQGGPDVETLLERCLSWDGRHRLDSAVVLAEELERVAAGKRIRTRPFSPVMRLRRVGVGLALRARGPLLAALLASVVGSLYLAALFLNVTTTADAAGVVAVEVREQVAIVGVTDETVEKLPALAVSLGIADVNTNVLSWRAVHGRLMERLAMAGPAVVLWDYCFRTDQAGDEALAAGANRLIEAGTPVVFAVNAFDDSGEAVLSSTIRRAIQGPLHHGAIVARHMTAREGEFVLAYRRPDGTTFPHVALAAWAAMRQPACGLELAWEGRDRVLGVLYETEPGVVLREQDRIAIEPPPVSGLSGGTVEAGDTLAYAMFPLDRPERWAKRALAYEWVLTAGDEELRQRLGGRAVIIGDMRTQQTAVVTDRHPVRYGGQVVEEVPGCYLMGDLLAGLMGQRFVRAAFPLAPGSLMMVLFSMGAAVPAGILAGRWRVLAGRARQAWALAVLGGVAIGGLVAMATAGTAGGVGGGMIAYAAGLTLAATLAVEFARQRHRLCEAALEHRDFVCLAAGETLTIN